MTVVKINLIAIPSRKRRKYRRIDLKKGTLVVSKIY